MSFSLTCGGCLVFPCNPLIYSLKRRQCSSANFKRMCKPTILLAENQALGLPAYPERSTIHQCIFVCRNGNDGALQQFHSGVVTAPARTWDRSKFEWSKPNANAHKYFCIDQCAHLVEAWASAFGCQMQNATQCAVFNARVGISTDNNFARVV